ncbi:hypothetical protein SAMN05216262_1473 [Colwellia chukchiensis]|uniref:Lipoprotein n=2 Tax=Colwellia chukchiensis TaxID=641665 RepID=A0A1H7UJA9_9GAMM|nr:hypothetical protein SAMN05216262_1473 [Colwellia chukchiensis]
MILKSQSKCLVALIILSLAGCSTTKAIHVACDFTAGAANNAINRDKNKNSSDIHGEKLKTNGNSDALEGVLGVISGVLTRSLNSNTQSKCTD